MVAPHDFVVVLWQQLAMCTLRLSVEEIIATLLALSDTVDPNTTALTDGSAYI